MCLQAASPGFVFRLLFLQLCLQRRANATARNCFLKPLTEDDNLHPSERRSGATCAIKQHHLDLSSACSSCSFVFSAELMQQLGTAFEAADSALEKTTISIQVSDGLEPRVLSSSITWICLPPALLAALSSAPSSCNSSELLLKPLTVQSRRRQSPSN